MTVMPGNPTCFRCIVRGAAVVSAVFLACAGAERSGNQPSLSKLLIAEADSLFTSDNFENAKAVYEKIRLGMPPESPEARKAHYYLAYINVFYKNPWADWNTALTEFTSFAALYPDDPHIDDVRSWIRILTTIKSFETEYRKTSHQVERLTADKNTTREVQRFHLDSMAAILRSSYESRDSLARTGDSLGRKNAELINTIINLEKKCQQAGK
jgi:outer membrane protein assembly factor BamD (BamD/ComL family)